MSGTHHRIRPARWASLSLALAVALVAGCSSGGTGTGSAGPSADSGPQTVQVRVTGNQVQPSERRVKVKLGDQVRLEVTADRADEVHLHGYDRKVEAQPGKTAVLEFRADTPGIFEVELEHAGIKLLELEVS